MSTFITYLCPLKIAAQNFHIILSANMVQKLNSQHSQVAKPAKNNPKLNIQYVTKMHCLSSLILVSSGAIIHSIYFIYLCSSSSIQAFPPLWKSLWIFSLLFLLLHFQMPAHGELVSISSTFYAFCSFFRRKCYAMLFSTFLIFLANNWQ